MYELNIVANFGWKPPQSEAQESALMQRPRKTAISEVWSPTRADFKAIAGRAAITCSNLYELLSAIYKQPPRSIGRLNIFSHGDTDMIAMKGYVDPGVDEASVYFEQVRRQMVHLDSDNLALLREPGRKFLVGGKMRSVDAVKERFSDTMAIFIYSCKSGVDQKLIQDVADTFDVMSVNGFKTRIAYCPQFQGNRIITRKRICIADVADPCYHSRSMSTSYYPLAPYAAANRLLVSAKGPSYR